MSVNLGIRVPECAVHSFCEIEPLKKYYHEYDCNIRTSLGFLADGKDTVYSLKKDPLKIGNDIVEKLEKYALPVFEALNSRDAILAHRREYPRFDRMNNHLILLEEAMIEGRRGNIAEATSLFNCYYRNALSDYNRDFELGRKYI